MTITAKFASTCAICKAPIAPGTAINWERGKPSTHADASLCAATLRGRPAPDLSAPVAAPVRPTVSLSGLVTFLRAARDRGLKFPKTRFAAPGNGELVISLAGDNSRNPGATYVKLNGEYAGKVTADGVAFGLDALLPTLRAIESDPAAAATAYGALTGRCSFCGLGLTDEGSIEVGYGPVCAKRYGLPHSPKGSAKVVPVVNATPAPVAEVPAWYSNEPGGDFDGTLDYNEGAAKAARLHRTVLCSDCGDYHTAGTGCADYDSL
jgi:hypothetical protein